MKNSPFMTLAIAGLLIEILGVVVDSTNLTTFGYALLLLSMAFSAAFREPFWRLK